MVWEVNTLAGEAVEYKCQSRVLGKQLPRDRTSVGVIKGKVFEYRELL